MNTLERSTPTEVTLNHNKEQQRETQKNDIVEQKAKMGIALLNDEYKEVY